MINHRYKKVGKSILVLLSMFFVVAGVKAQQITIHGTVIDAKTKKVMPGVNIAVRGTTNGTSTDRNGKFELSVSSKQDALIFSFVGYEKRIIPIQRRSNLGKIQMKPITNQLKGLVVVGYGKQKAVDISSSIGTVDSSQFENQPATRVSEALDGKISGARVQRTSGKPGSGFKIRIRGSNSINGSNDPLYIVNGLQKKNVNDVNPNDIASIKVLKDAAATAIYGSRGSNGVVLITTKSGSQGKMKIDFKSSVGLQSVEKRLDLLNAAQFARTVNAERKATGNNPPFSNQQIADFEASGGTNWQDLAFRNGAPLQQYHLSFSGGSSNVNYFISGGYLKQKGDVIQQNYKRYNIRSKINYEYSDKLKFSIDINGSREGRNGNIMNVNTAVQFDPTLAPLKDKNGNYTLSSSYANITTNPYIQTVKSNRQDFDGTINTVGTIQYNITKALSLNILGGFNLSKDNRRAYNSRILDNRGQAIIESNQTLQGQNTNRLTFDKDLNTNNHLKIDFIFEQQYIRNDIYNTNAYDFPTDATGYKKLGIASTVKASSSFNTQKLLSYIGRIHYVWQNKYIFTASARYDGSSKFRKGNRYGFFPAGSIGWRVAKEKFMKNLTFVNQFKLRASYGATGSQAIAPLATRERLVSGNNFNYPIDNGGTRVVGIAPSNNLENTNLTWETTKQADIGVDMGFLDSRISFTADVYRKETTDLLLNVPLANFTGVNDVARNSGKIQNKGLELSLGLIPVQNKRLSFNANFNVSFNRNEVKSLGGQKKILRGVHNGATGGVYPVVIQNGHPLGTFQGYTFEGIYQKDQAKQAAKFGKQPGDAIYEDINGDGKINGQDISIIGNAQPDFNYGFNATLGYENFDLNLVIKGAYGGQIYNITQGELYGQSAQTLDPVGTIILKRWTPDNPSNTIPGFTTTTQTFLAASNFVENGTYLKIRNIELGYTLPEKYFNRIPVKSLKVSVSAQNLATFTKFKGFDPELHRNGNTDWDRGLYYEFPSYPLSRTITIGINIKL